jgi:hypothetical protein
MVDDSTGILNSPASEVKHHNVFMEALRGALTDNSLDGMIPVDAVW